LHTYSEVVPEKQDLPGQNCYMHGHVQNVKCRIRNSTTLAQTMITYHSYHWIIIELKERMITEVVVISNHMQASGPSEYLIRWCYIIYGFADISYFSQCLEKIVT